MGKLKYVLERLLLAFITGFIILTITFILVKLLPEAKPAGDVGAQLSYYNNQVRLGYYTSSPFFMADLGDPTWTYTADDGTMMYFYKLPIMTQYGNWLRNVFTKWDWGTSSSIDRNRDVFVMIGERLPPTIVVNVITFALAVPLGIALGIWSALKRNKPTDRVISVLVMVFISIPSFVFISLLIIIFGYTLNWLPVRWPATTATMGTRAAGLVIPVLAGAFGSICGYERLVRGELIEALSSDYLLLARTKGLTKGQSVVRHALRNAMVPILPSILAQIVGILGGSAILEQIYSIPGIGQLFILSIQTLDINVMLADMTVFTMIGLLAGIVLDLSYGFLDPRIRMGERK